MLSYKNNLLKNINFHDLNISQCFQEKLGYLVEWHLYTSNYESMIIAS